MQKINIIIKQVKNRDGEFIAFHSTNTLEATFSVYFRDNIYGSMALNHFSQMIKYRFPNDRIDFTLSSQKLTFSNPYLLDVMSGKMEVSND